MPRVPTRSLPAWFQPVMYGCIVLLLAFFTYAFRYSYPPHTFWDEPYHIASAQKYLNGVQFMEQHPPLGKLLIALGEKIVNANAKDNIFLNTDYGREFPEGFSFAGYRLFPALLAFLSAGLLYAIFYLLSRNAQISGLLTFPYVFDNALIVHSRGAMLEPTLIFFSLLTLLATTILLLRGKTLSPRQFILVSILLGGAFGLALTTKVVALVLILAFPVVAFSLRKDYRKLFSFILYALYGFLIAYCAVWYTHFSLGKTINPSLPNNGYYQTSKQYKEILKNGETSALKHFPIMLRDSLKFVRHYNKGVPRLDLCKADENGSPAFFWPFGARAINYRWQQVNDTTFMYLYLQSNPVAWTVGLLGVLGCLVLLLSAALNNSLKKLEHPQVMATLLLLYVGYMVAIMQIDRVMYLYHYFLPLVLSFMLFGLFALNIHQFLRWKISEDHKTIGLIIVSLCVFVGFQLYRPLSYYQPITNAAVERRSLLDIWNLHCVHCSPKSGIVSPQKSS